MKPKKAVINMPKINIAQLPSFTRYLEKSGAHFKIKENEYALLDRNGITLIVYPQACVNNDHDVGHNDAEDSKEIESSIKRSGHRYQHHHQHHLHYQRKQQQQKQQKQQEAQDYVVVRTSDNSEYRFLWTEIPKQYWVFYWYLFKLVRKARRKIILYRLVRTRQKNPSDRVKCLVSLAQTYTVQFQGGGIAFLKDAYQSDLKYFLYGRPRMIPFSWNRQNPRKTTMFNDQYDYIRVIVHDFVQVAHSLMKKGQHTKDIAKGGGYSYEWNADTGELFEENPDKCGKDVDATYYDDTSVYNQPEGLFKTECHTDTSLSSDYSDTNSEIAWGSSSKNKSKNKSKNSKLVSHQDEQKGNVSSESQKKDDTHHSLLTDDNQQFFAEKSLPTVTQASFASTGSIRSEASWRRNPRNQYY
mmetsp:Transcript_51726/g.85676  ORF Transcript_51726/g.85676 Transcript_51726/m.85676 type:complete len:413 (-) Transcript_51726:106-1344(-)